MVRLPVALQALLIAAAFCLLFVAPAAAHPGEGHGSVTGRTVISDAPVDRVSPDLKEPEARNVVFPPRRLPGRRAVVAVLEARWPLAWVEVGAGKQPVTQWHK